MNLSELHQRLSKKPTYRKAYDAIGDVVLIGAAVRKLREDSEMTQQELASKLEISQFYLSRLETGSGKVSLNVVSAVVRYFEEEMRGLGINVGPWLVTAPETIPTERPAASQHPIFPERHARTRRPVVAEELAEGVLHDRPVPYKHGKPH
jgi:transcriptional regulator with XRE-family HTH domain